jgi:hypothetical protein
LLTRDYPEFAGHLPDLAFRCTGKTVRQSIGMNGYM